MSQKITYRVTAFFKRKPGITEEEFSHHWYNIHGPLCVPWIIKHGITQYTQFHTPSSLRDKAAGPIKARDSSFDYDGGADFYVDSYEAYEEAFKDPYYINVIEPDEHNFVHKGAPGETTIVEAVSIVGIAKNIVFDGKSVVPDAELSEQQRKFL